MTLPTLSEIVTEVTGFAADYMVYFVAGVTVSLIAFGLTRIIKAGR